MRKTKAFSVIPTLLTLGNAAAGFGAITFAAKVGPESAAGNELLIASILIFVAMLFDMLDGSAARWANQESDFGAQLDSLCDAISFGVAPAFLMLQFTLNSSSFGQGNPVPLIYPARLLWVIAVLFVLCVLLRLARFNVETEEDDSHSDFSGLPSPAAAGVVASFPIAMRGLNRLAHEGQEIPREIAEWVIPVVRLGLPLITFAVACLMVSRFRYPHVFSQMFQGTKNRQYMLQLVFTIAAAFVVQEMAIPLIFCYFAFAAPAHAVGSELWNRSLHRS